MQIKFESTSGNNKQTFEINAENWADITEKFYFFLLGSGYVLSIKDLADAFDFMAGEYDAMNKNYSEFGKQNGRLD